MYCVILYWQFTIKILLSLIYVCLVTINLTSQTKQIIHHQITECGLPFFKNIEKITNCTINTNCDIPATRDLYLWNPANDIKVIKTKIRVVSETDGSNPAASEREVMMQMHYLNKDYAPIGIQFTYEIDYINDSAFRTSSSIPFLLQKMTQYTNDPGNYCNIFVATGPASFGFYPWLNVGYVGLFINAPLQFYPGNNRSSLTHEMGHELGLYHTFTGYNEVTSCTDDCAENTGTTNNDLRGDFCSDTPPQEVSSEYGFIPTMDLCNQPNYFSEIPHINYMSYADSKLEFTQQQVARMHCFLETHPDRINWLDSSNPEIPYVYQDNFGNRFTEEYGIYDLNWIDITDTGEEITGLLDDNFIGPFNLGFEFQFYGQSFTEFYIGSNGYISFSPFILSYSSDPFPSIPSSDSRNGFIAPFLADLTFSGSDNNGKVYFFTDKNSFIVSFINVPIHNQSNGFEGSNTFQVIFNKNENKIYYQYLHMDDYYPPTFHKIMKPSVIGIESPDGLDGLEVNNFQIPSDSSRITIDLKTPVLSVEDNKIKKPVSVNVYPNPSSTTFNFNWDQEKNVDISVFNITGERIQHFKKVNAASHVWNLQNTRIPSGIYFYSIIGRNIKHSGKLIIIR